MQRGRVPPQSQLTSAIDGTFNTSLHMDGTCTFPLDETSTSVLDDKAWMHMTIMNNVIVNDDGDEFLIRHYLSSLY